MACLRLLVLCSIVIASSAYENKLTKLWSSVTPQRTVLDVESDTYIVSPEGYGGADPVQRSQRVVYEFKPRSIPLKEPETTVERTVRYSDIRNADQFKTEILFPGSYFPIADAKKENDSGFDPLARSPFTPKIIPLMREEYEVQGRSFDGDSGVQGVQDQPTAMRRSYGYFGEDEDEEDGKDDDEEEDDEEKEENGSTRKKGPKIKKKYMKYMLPLLLAYKLKFFTLIPLLMGGMVLLTGATGLAGFFFALFAAVMGLSKTTGH